MARDMDSSPSAPVAEPQRWEELGLDDRTLEQSPLVSLRTNAVPPPARLPSDDEQPLTMLRTLGEGGMGIVRLARQRTLQREVAVKTVKASAGERARSGLLSEALVTGALEHPNIIPIYAIDEDELGAPLIVMKRVEGVSWHALLHGDAKLPAEAEDPLEWHLGVLVQVAAAIEFAHRRGIIHRDLKPENVMIGGLGEVYVLDWGLGVSLREEDRGLFPLVSDVRGIAGTPAYMAPEMMSEDGAGLGTHTDVYLLGAILHEIVTGEARHAGANVMAVLSSVAASEPYDYPRNVPAELAAICHRAMARSAADRFGSAEQLRAAILAFSRHRSSIRLSDEAAQRLTRMKELLAPAQLDGADVDRHREVRDLFGAARFGFEQALAAWSDNVAARAGARDALVTIALSELAQRNLAAARAYLAALVDPPSALVDRASALARELDAEREEYERLRRDARESDRGLGASRRAAAGVLFGIGAAGSLLLIQWGDASGAMPLSTRSYLGWIVGLVVCSALCIHLFRDVLFSNRVNRQVFLGTAVTLASVAALRAIVVLSGIDIHVGFRLELVAYAMGFAMLGIVSNLRALLAALLCIVGALLDAALDRGDLYVVAATVFGAFAALSWAWASTAKPATDIPPRTP